MSPRGLHAGAQKSPSICLVPNISAEVEELAAAEAAKAGPSPWGFGYTFGALIVGIGFCGPLYYNLSKSSDMGVSENKEVPHYFGVLTTRSLVFGVLY